VETILNTWDQRQLMLQLVTEILKRICMENETKKLNGILWNMNIPKLNQKNIFHSIVERTVLYGSETCQLVEKLRYRITGIEIRLFKQTS
jgi:hypothetical protein